MKRAHGLLGSAVTLLISLVAAGCSPKQEAAESGATGSTVQTATVDSANPVKLETATLKAVGMT